MAKLLTSGSHRRHFYTVGLTIEYHLSVLRNAMLLTPLVSYLSFFPSLSDRVGGGMEWGGVGVGQPDPEPGVSRRQGNFPCLQSLLSTGLNSTRQFPNVTPFTRLPVPSRFPVSQHSPCDFLRTPPPPPARTPPLVSVVSACHHWTPAPELLGASHRQWVP